MFNIFSSKKGNGSALTCKVSSKVSSTLYLVTDRTGGKFKAESNGDYKVGEWVIVSNNIIVGKTKKPKEPLHVIV